MSAIIGIIAALAVIVLAALSDGDPIKSLFSVTAVLIVFGGTLTALLTQFGFGPLLAGFARFKWLIKPPLVDLYAFIDQVANWSNLARSQGVLALEAELVNVTDPFLKRGLQMIIDNTSQDDLYATLTVLAEKSSREEHVSGEIWEAGGGYLPTIGVMGAVLGLIHVMMRLDHPAELGEGIATAFVATIYGVGGANLIFLPVGQRLLGLAEARERERQVMIQGFILLSEGKPGILIRQGLMSFLKEKKEKANADAQGEGAMGEPMAEAA
jgi:chemotaxis protein MotA